MSKFRLWLQAMWYDHLDELDVIGQRPNAKYTLADYFNRHKYWLKREYRHQQRNNNI
jgi:hypothetical protein